jgi:Cu2+-containing amine oxidase
MNHARAPLNQSEISTVVIVTRRDGGLDQSAWFETISLDESDQFPQQRCAYVCCYEASSNRTFTGLVQLDQQSLQNWRHVEGVQPRITPDEFGMACDLAREGFDGGVLSPYWDPVQQYFAGLVTEAIAN